MDRGARKVRHNWVTSLHWVLTLFSTLCDWYYYPYFKNGGRDTKRSHNYWLSRKAWRIWTWVSCSSLSCVQLCDPMHCSLPGSSVHGILQARILEWVVFPSPGDLPDPGIEPCLPHCRQILYCLSHQGSPIFLQSLSPFHFTKGLKLDTLNCLWVLFNLLKIHFHFYNNSETLLDGYSESAQ